VASNSDWTIRISACRVRAPRRSFNPIREGRAPRMTSSTRDGARATLAVTRDIGFGEFAAELGYRDSVRTSLFRDYSGSGSDTYTDTRTSTWSFTPTPEDSLRSAGLSP